MGGSLPADFERKNMRILTPFSTVWELRWYSVHRDRLNK